MARKRIDLPKKNGTATRYPHEANAIASAHILRASGLFGNDTTAIADALEAVANATNGTFDPQAARQYVAFMKAHPTASQGDYPKQFQGTNHQWDAEANYVVTHVLHTVTHAPDPGFADPLGPSVSGIASVFGDIGALASALMSSTFWIRAGEVVLGGVIIIVGIDQMTKSGFIKKGAKTVAEGALL